MSASKRLQISFPTGEVIETQDPCSKLLWDPPLESDELIDILREIYPSIKTHTERKRQAALDFLTNKKQEIISLERSFSLSAMFGQTTKVAQLSHIQDSDSTMRPPSVTTKRPSPSGPDEERQRAPVTNIVSVVRPVYDRNKSTEQRITLIDSGLSDIEPPPAKSASGGENYVWNFRKNGELKRLTTRGRMTREQKKDYRLKRKRGACTECRWRKRKCHHDPGSLQTEGCSIAGHSKGTVTGNNLAQTSIHLSAVNFNDALPSARAGEAEAPDLVRDTVQQVESIELQAGETSRIQGAPRTSTSKVSSTSITASEDHPVIQDQHLAQSGFQFANSHCDVPISTILSATPLPEVDLEADGGSDQGDSLSSLNTGSIQYDCSGNHGDVFLQSGWDFSIFDLPRVSVGPRLDLANPPRSCVLDTGSKLNILSFGPDPGMSFGSGFIEEPQAPEYAWSVPDSGGVCPNVLRILGDTDLLGDSIHWGFHQAETQERRNDDNTGFVDDRWLLSIISFVLLVFPIFWSCCYRTGCIGRRWKSRTSVSLAWN